MQNLSDVHAEDLRVSDLDAAEMRQAIVVHRTGDQVFVMWDNNTQGTYPLHYQFQSIIRRA
jgi:hypothetical protein